MSRLLRSLRGRTALLAKEDNCAKCRDADEWAAVVYNLAVVLQGHGLRDQPDLLREAAETFVALAISPAASGTLSQFCVYTIDLL